MKTNLLDYLGDKIDGVDFDGDLNLNWDKESRVFELEFTMYTEGTADYEVKDQEDQIIGEDGEVDYSDAILLYDQTKLNGQDYAANYLAVLGFDGKQGLAKATVDGLFVYLQELLDDGQSDLFDFVDGTSEAETFELQFDQARFQALVAAEPAAAKHDLIPYPHY